MVVVIRSVISPAVAPLEVVPVEPRLFVLRSVLTIGRWFHRTFLPELQVSLEVLLRLDFQSFLAPVAQLAAEHLVAAEFALKRTVVEHDAGGWTHADALEALLAIAEYPCVVVDERMLERAADVAVQAQDVVGGDTLAVGRIGHHDGGFGGLLQVAHVLLTDYDVVGNAGGLRILRRNGNGRMVDVVAVDFMVKLALLRVVVVDSVEKLGVEVLPALECKLFAEHARVDIPCDKGSLDENGARAAHGVDKVGLAVPSRQENHPSRQHFVERRSDRACPVAP